MEALINWKRLSDREGIDLKSYLEDWIKKNPVHKLYIGCDSHNERSETTFATVIVLHYGIGGGGHVLYSRDTCSIVKDRYERLWREVELSVTVAQTLIEMGFEKPDYIDIDLNPDPKYKSNSVLRSAVGMIESLGITPRYKTKSPWAISIADCICK
jgi:predicted RNase H-related nuclease YkuK (DUF458 family)